MMHRPNRRPSRNRGFARVSRAPLLAALLGSSPGLRVNSRYRADGKSGDLNSYLLLRRSDG